jgi:WD40 repeat protein
MLLFLCASLFLVFTSQADSQGKKKPKTPIWSDQKDAHGDPLPIGAVARIGTLRYRLPDFRGPKGALPSPDGKLLAALGMDNDIEIFELPAWKRLRVITGRSIGIGKKDDPPGQFQGLAFSADGKKLVTCDVNSMQMHLLDLTTGKSLKKIGLLDKTGMQDPFLMLSRDEQTLVCTYLDNQGKGVSQRVIVWDLLAKEKVQTNISLPIDPNNGNRPNVSISADCRWLAQSVANENPNRPGRGLESRIELWDLTTGKLVHKIETDAPMPRLALSPDGKWLAAANDNSLLRIYEASTGKELHNIRGRTALQHLQFSPDGAALYVADHDGKIHRWNPVSGERTASWKAPGRMVVSQLVFPPQGKMLALGLNMEAVHFWEVETGKLLSPKDLPADPISEVEFSPQGELFVATEVGMTAWWNPRTGAKLRDLKLEFLDGDERALPFYRNDIILDGFLQPRRGFDRRGNAGVGSLFGLSPSSEFLVSSNGGGMAFYDAKTGKLLYDEDAGRGDIGNGEVAFLDGGSKSASMQGKKVRIWNTRTGRDVASFIIPLREQEQAVRFAASSTGKHFAIQVNGQAEGGGGRVFVWDADKKKILREWPTQNGVDTMQFSPDQQWLAVARPQERLQLTRIGAARADYDLGVGKNPIDCTQAVFSPDSRQLACATLLSTETGRNSSKIYIYEIASKKLRLELVGHPAGIIDRLAYSHDSGLLASGATDTTALVWKAGLRGFADKPLAEDAPAADLDAWFTQMAGTDAKRAFQGMIQLARARKQTVKLLEEKIAPAKKPDTGEKTVKQWIQDLGSGQFAVRTKANLMLQKIGPAAEPELRQANANANDIETRRRIEELLDRLALHEWTAAEVMHARAVEVLETIGTPEARATLTRWTTGDPAAILTLEARKALASLLK